MQGEEARVAGLSCTLEKVNLLPLTLYLPLHWAGACCLHGVWSRDRDTYFKETFDS